MNSFNSFASVIRLGRAEWRLATFFVVLSAGIAALQLIEPLLFGWVIDALSKEAEFAHHLGLWMGLAAINATLSILLSVSSDRYAHRQRLKAMQLAFAAAVHLPYKRHVQDGTGRHTRTIQAGTDQVFYVTLSFFRENLIAIFNIAILIPLSLMLEPRLASVLLLLAAVYGFGNWIIMRHTFARQAMVEVGHQGLSAQITDVMANVTIVRAYTRIQRELTLFATSIAKVLAAQYPVLNWWGVLNVLTRLASMLAMLAIVAIGASMVQNAKASQGEVVTFVGFSSLMISRLDQLASFCNRLVTQSSTIKNLFALIEDEAESKQQGSDFVQRPVQGQVQFEDVTFRHGEHGNAPGVSAISFVAQPGKTIALVGPTGAGKSTCLQLLQRLHHPDAGRIMIDGQDITELSVVSLCRSIATVFQDPGLFNRSVYENILIGRPEATRAEVYAAARQAKAHEFIVARPGGYDFVVGERGTLLSGGERQRLAIARAFLKNAPILVLDEATSALDNETERAVQTAMETLSRGKTTFVIAHRLSTIITADLILVMAEGRIVQRGTFEQLRSMPGLFARLLHAGNLGGTYHANASATILDEDSTATRAGSLPASFSTSEAKANLRQAVRSSS